MEKETKPLGSSSIGGDECVNTLDIEVTPKQRMFMDATQDEVLYGGAA